MANPNDRIQAGESAAGPEGVASASSAQVDGPKAAPASTPADGGLVEALKSARETLAVAKAFVGASAFNLGQSPSKNSRRSARDYSATERRIEAEIASIDDALVRAVNSHDAMKAALEAAEKKIASCYIEASAVEKDETIVLIRAAISLTEQVKS